MGDLRQFDSYCDRRQERRQQFLDRRNKLIWNSSAAAWIPYPSPIERKEFSQVCDRKLVVTAEIDRFAQFDAPFVEHERIVEHARCGWVEKRFANNAGRGHDSRKRSG